MEKRIHTYSDALNNTGVTEVHSEHLEHLWFILSLLHWGASVAEMHGKPTSRGRTGATLLSVTVLWTLLGLDDRHDFCFLVLGFGRWSKTYFWMLAACKTLLLGLQESEFTPKTVEPPELYIWHTNVGQDCCKFASPRLRFLLKQMEHFFCSKTCTSATRGCQRLHDDFVCLQNAPRISLLFKNESDT